MIASKAQNSPPSLIYAKFSQTSDTFVLFLRGNSFYLCCIGNLSTIKSAICIFKARLGGEICWSDVIMHKGYWKHELFETLSIFRLLLSPPPVTGKSSDPPLLSFKVSIILLQLLSLNLAALSEVCSICYYKVAREKESSFVLNISCCNYYSSFASTCVYITSTERFDCHVNLNEFNDIMEIKINYKSWPRL